MDTQLLVDDLDKAVIAEIPVARTTEAVSDDHFEEIVLAALDCVGGTMLFKMMTGSGDDAKHVAAGAVYEGEGRHYLILSMPIAGGPLQVEQAANSKSPIAAIAASYASLADIFGTA